MLTPEMIKTLEAQDAATTIRNAVETITNSGYQVNNDQVDLALDMLIQTAEKLESV